MSPGFLLSLPGFGFPTLLIRDGYCRYPLGYVTPASATPVLSVVPVPPGPESRTIGPLPFGFWGGWSIYNNAPLGTQTLPNTDEAEANSAAPPCINQDYRGISGHWIIGNNNNFYWAVTLKDNDVNNCL